MESDFKIQCPYCSKEIDFIDDNWQDELIDDSDDTYTDCVHCDYPLKIQTKVVYTLKVLNCEIESFEEYIDNQNN